VDASDPLIALAQVAVTLAGFSGIVVVLGRRSRGEFTASERLGLGSLLRPSLGVVLWSLVPLVLESAHVAEPALWTSVSALYFAYIAAMLALFAMPQARAAGAMFEARWVIASSVAAQLLLLLGNALWIRDAWPYLTSLLISLLISALAFARMLIPRA
jgi:hypothetical protein